MAASSVSHAKLRKDIKQILEGADLTCLSSKKVRKTLEEKYGQDLTAQKKGIDQLTMTLIEELEDLNESESEQVEEKTEEIKPVTTVNGNPTDDVSSDDDGPEDRSVAPSRKRKGKAVKTSPTKKNKSKTVNASPAKKSESETESLDDEELAKQLQDEENTRSRRTRAQPKKKPKPKGERAPKQKPTKIRNCILSETLQDVMGEEKLPRSEVVKRMWEIIKERDLFDPKNKQFMICDKQLEKLFGRKRVRCFGMLKYLKKHIYQENV